MIPAPPAYAAERYTHAVARPHDEPRAAEKRRASECREPCRTGDEKIAAIKVFFVWHESPYPRYLSVSSISFVVPAKGSPPLVSNSIEKYPRYELCRAFSNILFKSTLYVLPPSDWSMPFTWHMLKTCFSIAATAFSFPSSPYCTTELPKSGRARRYGLFTFSMTFTMKNGSSAVALSFSRLTTTFRLPPYSANRARWMAAASRSGFCSFWAERCCRMLGEPMVAATSTHLQASWTAASAVLVSVVAKHLPGTPRSTICERALVRASRKLSR